MTVDVVGIVGAGTMGSGIAQVALEHGHEVVLHDVDQAAIVRGRERVRDGLARRAGKLGLDADTIDDWTEARLANLRDAETVALVATQSDVVIEAAVEDLELKRDVFRALDASSEPDTILATNTSALSVGAIAEATARPERVVGLHFFNPAPLMRLVEVVATSRTDRDALARASALVASWDRVAVRSADVPGFIVNRVNRPFTIEALRILEAGDASVEGIDAALRDDGFPMGPFELMDLTGIDVSLAAARSIWEGLGRPDRLRPSPIHERLVAEGNVGRKTGEGFYRYDGGRRAEVSAQFVSPGAGLGAEAIRARILRRIEAEARLAAQDGVATESDIDVALRLGAAHPLGPFERASTPGG
jgi:3-hydroxybutyryl-CoA dehydrogenase